MTVYQYHVVFFCANSTATQRSGAHRHTVLYLPAIGAFSWGQVDGGFGVMGPGTRRSSTPVQLNAGVYYHESQGYGHSVLVGTTADTTAPTITTWGTTWYAANERGGAYPSNCRGAVDSFLASFAGAPTANNATTQLNTLFAACR